MATAAAIAACSYSYFYLTKSKAMKRFDIDNRFTDSISYNNMVFISGQVGEGETIEEQTISALKSVDVALSKVSINIFSY
jgi:enamine deaminase RidA (YjgF/YER057c/UK114 family)